MEAVPVPDAVCEGGDLDCGSGLLLLIREAMQPLRSGGVLEVRSREISVKEDLPAWCRMVGHEMPAVKKAEAGSTSYFIRKKSADDGLKADLDKARGFEWPVRVRWTGGMQAKAFARNHSFVVGQPASFETADSAPAAVEYLLASLGGCLAVGFQWRASRKGLEVRNLEVALRAKADNILVFLGVEDSGHPGLSSLEATLYVDADGEDAELRAVWEDTVKRSPVAQTLLRGVPVKTTLRRS
jgi:uncharacterized OsmC-like protein/TusA-related sulfurtransferase